MNAERWQRIEQLFHESSLLPPERLKPWLAERCAGDADLERDVLRLLDSDRQSETAVRQLIAEASHDLLTAESVSSETFVNARVGAWRVDSLLGVGGMGLVFLAHRDDGRFEQKAAIKLLRLTLATPADLARFRRERRILARLEHRHIARLLDAGEHSMGNGLEIPYFVMEHVAGKPLTVYAGERGLSARQRVLLFQQVLDAVGYAHQCFVLHRDLKPANILVTADGVVKLLDFGIAQLLEGDPAGAADRTRSTLMTPDYASPEQLRGDPLTVQSDVFTLGALLYELLSTRRAYEALGQESPTERAMAMTARPAPSLGVDADLDTIVAKAIHPELSRRYPSVESFTADLRRYLAGQPVSARRDSSWYRATKFAGRHRWPLAAAAVLVMSLSAGVVATAYEARRANQHLAQLRQLSGRLLFQVHDAVENLQGATKARELLASTSAEYLDGLSAAAGNDPAFLNDLASAYERLGKIFGGPNGGHLGRINDSIATYRKAIDVYRRLEAIKPADTDLLVRESRTWLSMGRVQSLSGDGVNATASLKTAYEIGRRASGPGKPPSFESIDALLYLGDIAFDNGQPRDALKYYLQALPDVERDAAAPNAALAQQRGLTNTQVRIGQAQLFLGNLEGARDEFQKTVERARVIAAANPNNAATQRDIFLMSDRLATVIGHPDHPNLGDPATAAAMYVEVVAQAERVAAADPQDMRARRDVAEMHASYGATLRDISPARGRDEYTRTLEIYRTLPDSLTKSPTVAQWIAEDERGLAISLANLGRADQAMPHFDHALSEFRRLGASQQAGVTLSHIARLRASTGEFAQARKIVDESIAILEPAWKEQRDNINMRQDLAEALAVKARIVAKADSCEAGRQWLHQSEQLWRELAGSEAAAYAESQLKKLALAPGCG